LLSVKLRYLVETEGNGTLDFAGETGKMLRGLSDALRKRV
jgi:hypothetical protein